jgi:hypothetical protein
MGKPKIWNAYTAVKPKNCVSVACFVFITELWNIFQTEAVNTFPLEVRKERTINNKLASCNMVRRFTVWCVTDTFCWNTCNRQDVNHILINYVVGSVLVIVGLVEQEIVSMSWGGYWMLEVLFNHMRFIYKDLLEACSFGPLPKLYKHRCLWAKLCHRLERVSWRRNAAFILGSQGVASPWSF